MQTIVVGLIAGTIYALLAAGITLVYKATRAVNFAQAEIGTLALYMTWWISGKHGQPWWVGALAALAVGIAVALLFERLVMRHLVAASQITKTVATIGLLGLLTGLEARWFAGSAKVFPAPLTHGGITVSGVLISPTQELAVVVVAVIAFALAVFLRGTRFGLAILASADDPVAAQLMGVPRARVSAVTWAIAGALSVIACLLIEPTVGVLAPGFASTLFINGLTAALLGGLTSLPGAFAGGLLVGLAEAEVVAHFVQYTQVPGPQNLGMLAIVLIVLLARPQGLLGARE
ncbi:MAG TPA: branched-chain amino acid ABC transporter permease [Mycobacteriales bacterium]|nr:branched-chain amino acid ABC transporter permease [Mycobacteriales bacterium]